MESSWFPLFSTNTHTHTHTQIYTHCHSPKTELLKDWDHVLTCLDSWSTVMFVERVCIPLCGWETFSVLLSSRKEVWQPHKVASLPVKPSFPCCPWCGPGPRPSRLPGVPVTRMGFHPCLPRVRFSQKLCFLFARKLNLLSVDQRDDKF